MEQANATSLFFPVGLSLLIGSAGLAAATVLLLHEFKAGVLLLIRRAALNTDNKLFLNSCPFASIILFGFVTKSIAPSSSAIIVVSASLLVRVLTITTFALILSFCNFSSSCRPSMRGMFTSRTTPSYFVLFIFSYASKPSLQTSVA